MIGSDVLSYASWAFLPDLLAQYLQSAYYAVFLPVGAPKPNLGTTIYSRHRLYCRIVVTICLLFYNLVEADWQIQTEGNYYSILEVLPTATEKEINTKFRRLSLAYHPDKVRFNPKISPDQAKEMYVRLRAAVDTLSSPLKRFAYDRFGPDIHACQHCGTVGDFIGDGLMRLVPGHVMSLLFMVFSNVFGYLKSGAYWRYLTLVSLVTFELYVILRPTLPFLTSFNELLAMLPVTIHPPVVQFQLLQLARRLAITIYLGLTQLQPLLAQLGIGGIAVLGGSNGKVNPGLSSAIRVHAVTMRGLAAGMEDDVKAAMEEKLAPYVVRSGSAGASSGRTPEVEKLKAEIVEKMVDEEMRKRMWLRSQAAGAEEKKEQ